MQVGRGRLTGGGWLTLSLDPDVLLKHMMSQQKKHKHFKGRVCLIRFCRLLVTTTTVMQRVSSSVSLCPFNKYLGFVASAPKSVLSCMASLQSASFSSIMAIMVWLLIDVIKVSMAQRQHQQTQHTHRISCACSLPELGQWLRCHGRRSHERRQRCVPETAR